MCMVQRNLQLHNFQVYFEVFHRKNSRITRQTKSRISFNLWEEEEWEVASLKLIIFVKLKKQLLRRYNINFTV